jgi:hypothetical protein
MMLTVGIPKTMPGEDIEVLAIDTSRFMTGTVLKIVGGED